MNTNDQTHAFQQQTLGQIAALFPRARMVLDEFDLDYCCDGNTTLAQAMSDQHQTTERIERQLNDVRFEMSEAVTATTPALTQQIVEGYHEQHRQDLPELIKLAARVEAVHQFDADTPVGLADALDDLRTYLNRHMAAEEQMLFPAMEQDERATVTDVLKVLRPSRAMFPAHIHQIEEITNHFELPPAACQTWQKLYFSTARFVDELRYHIHLENNVLFRRFRVD